MPTKATVLLTGATGFIGGHLARTLLRAGYIVYAPIRPESLDKVADLQSNDKFHPLTGTFYDLSLLETIAAPLDFVVHSAAIRGGGRADAATYRRVNVQGTQRLIDFARRRGVSGFVYLSTVGVLGTIPASQPAAEDQPPQPDGWYHQSKWQGEQIVRQAAGDTPCLILRPTITYGAEDDGFIFKLHHLIRQKKMALPAVPVMVHLLSVEALCRLISHILLNRQFNGKSYIIADKEPVSLQSVADIMARSGGKYFTLPKAFFRMVDMVLAALRQPALRTSVQLISRHWTYDIRAALRDLNYKPLETQTQLQQLLEVYEPTNK